MLERKGPQEVLIFLISGYSESGILLKALFRILVEYLVSISVWGPSSMCILMTPVLSNHKKTGNVKNRYSHRARIVGRSSDRKRWEKRLGY